MSINLLSIIEPAARAAPLRRTSYVCEVDAVRALAIGLVLALHGGIAPFGWAGVWVFFVISGFAVTTSLMRAEGGAGLRRVLHFYGRRCLRIWPLYFGFLLVNVAFLVGTGRFGPLEDLPYLLSFTYNLKLIFTEHGSAASWPPFGAMWSLAVEEQFYLFFPWLFVGLTRRRLVVVLLCIIAAAPLIRWGWGEWISSFAWPNSRVALSVYAFGPAHFDAFAAGALIALNRAWIERSATAVRGCAVGVLLAAGLYAGSFVTLQAVRGGRLGSAFHNVVSGVLLGDLREVFVYPVMWSLAGALLMLILSGERTVLALCRLPGLQAVGRVSFGIYMVNLPLFLLARARLPTLPDRLYDPLALACVVPASFALAWLSWRFYERRFLQARSRVG